MHGKAGDFRFNSDNRRQRHRRGLRREAILQAAGVSAVAYAAFGPYVPKAANAASDPVSACSKLAAVQIAAKCSAAQVFTPVCT